MANLSSTVRAPRLVGAGLGLQLAGWDKPLPLLVHNLGWSSSASFQSPRRRTCYKGFPETGSNVGEGMAARRHGARDCYYPTACGDFSSSRADFWNEVDEFNEPEEDKIAATTSCFQL
jgi:hypothetical protein